MHQVEVGLLAAGHVLVAGVAAEGRHQGEPATFEKIFDDERVAADVVLAQHVDLEFALDRPLGLADDVLEELVVGDVVSGRLADALVALATEAEDIDAQFLLHLAGHGMNVVADQSDRTGGADRDHPGLEDLVGLKDGLLELLLAAEDDLAVTRAPRHDILIIAGTRPECIKLAPVVRELAHRRAFGGIVANSGQHRGSGAAHVRRVPRELRRRAACPAAFPQPGRREPPLVARLKDVIAHVRPSLVVVQGDTLTAYAGARAGSEAGYPVVHVEAGLRAPSASDPFPEEWFRRRIARHAQFHFAPCDSAYFNLSAEGTPRERIHQVGNTGIDSLRALLAQHPVAPPRRSSPGARHAAPARELGLQGGRDLRRAPRARERAAGPSHAGARASQPPHRAAPSQAPFRPRPFHAGGAARLPRVHHGGRGCRARHQRFGRHPGRSAAPWRSAARAALVHRAAGRRCDRIRAHRGGRSRFDRARGPLDACGPRRLALPFDRAAPFGDGTAAARIVDVLESALADAAAA